MGAGNILNRGFPKDIRTSIERHKELAIESKKNGFELIDVTWLGINVKHKFKHIENGEVYEWIPKQVLGKDGFPKNLKKDAQRLDELLLLSENNGFQMLERKWLGWGGVYTFKHIASGIHYDWKASNILTRGFPKDLRTNVDKFNDLLSSGLKNGFQLLEKEWLGVKTKHRFIHIKSGTAYAGAPDHLMGAQGFPSYIDWELDKLAELAMLAQSNGFELLDKEWLGYTKKYQFLDISTGTVCLWNMEHIKKQGATLTIDGIRQRLNSSKAFEKLKSLAKVEGFELLNTDWGGVNQEHSFKKIDNGLVYKWLPSNVLYNGFPKDLRTDSDKLIELYDFSLAQGFNLVEQHWLGSTIDHKFIQISTGLAYMGRPANVMRRGFPKDIRGDVEKFLELRAFASAENYEVVTNEWLGSNNDHVFKHIDTGTIYKGRPSNLKLRGFPMLAGQRYLTEEVCRQAMRHIFGGDFKSDKQRLKSIHGRPMELDGFEKFNTAPHILDALNGIQKNLNEQIHEIAFEFQGHCSHRDDERIIERDKLRAEYCRKLGILLVVIDPPENWDRNRDSEYMYQHVCAAVEKSISFAAKLSFKSGFVIDLCKWNPDLLKYRELKETARDQGFELLDLSWRGARAKYHFQNIKDGSIRTVGYYKALSENCFSKIYKAPAEKLEALSMIATEQGIGVASL